MTAPMTVEGFHEATRVSRETLERLKQYAALLVKWNDAINLVSDRSLEDLWRRHMLDSAQLRPLLPPAPEDRPRTVVDLGSGAGFPGMVLSILGAGEVHLIEADQRKVQFLREVARAVESDAHIHGVRIQDLRSVQADVVTARALAPVKDLIGYAAMFLQPEGYALFLKGKRVREELTEAEKQWKIRADCIPSRSDPSGIILQIGLLASDGAGHGLDD
jgi:16S rRNA (guanine527-N7)-methyltransferase